MLSSIRLASILCATSGLMAQTMSDLNSPVLQAGRFADHQSAGQAPRPELTLFRIIGGSGGGEEAVMRTGVDIQQWTLVYQVDFKCPLDHLFVGISAQTGKKLWTEPFPY